MKRRKRIHPIMLLDEWWARSSPNRRLDRNMANTFMLIGLMCPTLSIVLNGPVPNSVLEDMPEWLQIWMCAFIFIGCGMKLHGILSGLKYYFPNTGVKHSYSWGVRGAPLATAGALVYGWFILSNTPNFFSALAGVSTPMFGLGIGFQSVLYWLEIRRIDRNERRLTADVKAQIADERNSDS